MVKTLNIIGFNNRPFSTNCAQNAGAQLGHVEISFFVQR